MNKKQKKWYAQSAVINGPVKAVPVIRTKLLHSHFALLNEIVKRKLDSPKGLNLIEFEIAIGGNNRLIIVRFLNS